MLLDGDDNAVIVSISYGEDNGVIRQQKVGRRISSSKQLAQLMEQN